MQEQGSAYFVFEGDAVEFAGRGDLLAGEGRRGELRLLRLLRNHACYATHNNNNKEEMSLDSVSEASRIAQSQHRTEHKSISQMRGPEG